MTDQSYVVYKFEGHPPQNPREIEALIKHADMVVFSTKPTPPETLCRVIDASNGKLRGLEIKNLSLLRARKQLVIYPSPSLCHSMVDLAVEVRFQPETEEQLKGLADFINMPKLQRMLLGASEYPTDAFMKGEEYQLDAAFNDGLAAQFIQLPGTLRMETPMQKRRDEMEADGRCFGKFISEVSTGVEVRDAITVSDPFQTMLDSLLNQALLGNAAVTTTTQAPQQLTKLQVRENAALGLAKMREVPKYQYMTEKQWTKSIEVITNKTLPPTLVSLSLVMLFPPAVSTIRIRILSGLDNLVELRLAYCGIDDAILDKIMPDLIHMPVLGILDLTRNNLIDANLHPIVERITSLTTLVLTHNRLSGNTVGRMFDAFVKEDANLHTLSHIDLSYNPFYGHGLSFLGITAWKPAETATLHLPNIFPSDIVGALEAIMPDGSTLYLEGEFPDNRAAYKPDAMLALLYGPE